MDENKKLSPEQIEKLMNDIEVEDPDNLEDDEDFYDDEYIDEDDEDDDEDDEDEPVGQDVDGDGYITSEEDPLVNDDDHPDGEISKKEQNILNIILKNKKIDEDEDDDLGDYI